MCDSAELKPRATRCSRSEAVVKRALWPAKTTWPALERVLALDFLARADNVIHARGRDHGDGGVYVARAGAWEASQQAGGYLGVWVRALRDAHWYAVAAETVSETVAKVIDDRRY